MKGLLLLSSALVCIVSAITSCKKESIDAKDITKTIVLPANGAAIVNANNAFAFNFLHAALQLDDADKNKLISPLSIYLALSMVYNGVDNATKDSMTKTLQLAGIDINSLNEVCNALITQLPQEDNRVTFSVANSIWYNKTLQPLNSFTDVVQNSYDAAVQALNFSDPSSAKTINDWVTEKTNGKIDKVISEISPTDLMYLINAIYFNGKWQQKFSASNTHNENFYLPGGSTKSVQFMQQQMDVNFYHDSAFTLIELPYGGGNSYSMYIALHNNKQQSINSFAASVNENVLANAISKMDTFNIKVMIPKWQYAYDIVAMQPKLGMLGMNIAFTGAADFSKMYDPAQVKPFITKSIHKTYIKVDEEGTEAAAVTVIGIGYTSVITPTLFIADHPFLYTIIEKQTGTVVFTGIVNDPSVN